MRMRPLLLFTLPFLLLAAGCLPVLAAGDPASPAATPSLEALVADYQALAPAAPGTSLSGRTARIGHLEIDFGQGVAFPLKSPGGVILGLLFEGKGGYRYRSEDPVDRRSLAANLGRRTRAPSLQDGVVRDELTRVFLLFGSEPSRDFWEPPAKGAAALPGPAATTAPLDASISSAFAGFWKGFLRTHLPWEHLALEARLNPGSSYLYAELQGSQATVGYVFDGTRCFEESLFLFRDLPQQDLRARDPLSVQRVKGGVAARPPDLLLKYAQIRIATEDNHSGTIASDLTLQVVGDGLRVARLDLLNNRDPSSYDWASPKNRLRVVKLTDETGASLPFSHRYHEILVQLRRAYKMGEFLNLKFETEGEVFTGLI